MSDESSAAIAATRRDWKTEHLEMYMSSDGVEGLLDVDDAGGAQQVAAVRLDAGEDEEDEVGDEGEGPHGEDGLAGLDAPAIIEKLDTMPVTDRPDDLIASVQPSELVLTSNDQTSLHLT